MAVSNAADYGMERLQPLIDRFTAAGVEEMNRTRSCFVAEVGGAIVGTGALEEDELLSFFVSPAMQGKGVGSALLAAVEAVALAEGLPGLRVASSIAGEAFYRSRGFRRTGEIEGAAGLHLAMVKELR